MTNYDKLIEEAYTTYQPDAWGVDCSLEEFKSYVYLKKNLIADVGWDIDTIHNALNYYNLIAIVTDIIDIVSPYFTVKTEKGYEIYEGY